MQGYVVFSFINNSSEQRQDDDSDLDGIYEWKICMVWITASSNINIDSDGDGFSDVEEYFSGVNPVDSNEHLN